jgi:Rrf2 family nitric oxide-sensitive transcriptional repressor
MQVTLHTDYALRMLMFLAARPETRTTVAVMARTFGLSPHHLVKVAQSLRELGYVELFRGRAGGVRLAMPAAEVQVGVVFRALENLHVVECFDPVADHCILSPSCVLRRALHQAVGAYLGVLDSYTLADLIRPRTLRQRIGPGRPGV